MYLPEEFSEKRIEAVHALMRRLGFATLLTVGPDGPEASHLPMFFDPAHAPFGILRAHAARGNHQFQAFDPAVPALAIFSGPHHYISPSWYPSKAEHGRAVPTWNYAVVHARGTLRVIEDRAWLRTHVEELVAREETRFAVPWHTSDAPPEYIERMLGGIVGLELTIERLEGKWKLSQNRSAADRAGAVAGLRTLGAHDLADLMEEPGKEPEQPYFPAN